MTCQDMISRDLNPQPCSTNWVILTDRFNQIITNNLYLGADIMKAAIGSASSTISLPTSHSRLLIVTGINKALPADFVETALRRVCNAHGGLYKDSIFLPTNQVQCWKYCSRYFNETILSLLLFRINFLVLKIDIYINDIRRLLLTCITILSSIKVDVMCNYLLCSLIQEKFQL